MAVVTKVRRLVANPHRSRKRKKSNPSGHRHRMTAKQIKFFGTSRQKSALKRKRSVSAQKVAVTRSHRKVRARRRNAPAKQKRQLNPALLITLGAVNPRRKAVATKRRKKAHTAANPHRRRRRNTRVVVAAPRRMSNPRHRRRRSNPRRRNPEAFNLKGMALGKAVISGLAGVAAAKFIPTLIPAQYISGNLMRTVATGASAVVAHMVAKQFIKDEAVANGVLFGGLMQTASTALNAFLPSIASTLGLNGMGQIMDADWSIPENPLKVRPAPVMVTPAGVAGLARAYGSY